MVILKLNKINIFKYIFHLIIYAQTYLRVKSMFSRWQVSEHVCWVSLTLNSLPAIVIHASNKQNEQITKWHKQFCSPGVHLLFPMWKESYTHRGGRLCPSTASTMKNSSMYMIVHISLSNSVTHHNLSYTSVTHYPSNSRT